MSKEFVAVVTDEMVSASKRFLVSMPDACMAVAIEDALAHPDFQRQVRAYAAAVARGLVASYIKPDYASPSSPLYEDGYEDGFGDCRYETLAAIERWEMADVP